jgi:hypothetical protein
MARPQQPELARSAKTDLDPDHIETGLQGQKAPATGGETGPVPPANQPGHHPPKEQDKPDLDAFAAKLGTDPKAPSATSARKPGRPKAASPKSAAAKTTDSKSAPAKSTPTKSTPAKSMPKPSQPAKSSTRPAAAAGSQSPAAAAKIETTPAKRPAAAPGWPESAPAAEDLGPLDQQPPTEEPLMVSLALLPLRETVKQLERLERRLTERLTSR